MPFTRDQATRLLTQPELNLFGDSRNPALRALSEKALSSRLERTRKLRDKSRDQLQRQKLKSRERTGSKLGASGVANLRTEKKGEILDDMLHRFETRLAQVQSTAKPVTGKKGQAHPDASAKTRNVVKKSTPAKPPGKSSSDAKVARTTKGPANKSITPKRALNNTRALLDAKKQRDRQLPAYLAIDSHAGIQAPDSGFQSESAKSKAQDLHAGEIRMEPLHGSISTQGRKNQGKRDKR